MIKCSFKIERVSASNCRSCLGDGRCQGRRQPARAASVPLTVASTQATCWPQQVTHVCANATRGRTKPGERYIHQPQHSSPSPIHAKFLSLGKFHKALCQRTFKELRVENSSTRFQEDPRKSGEEEVAPLNIKHPEADRLARGLAKRTGESITDAVIKALRERLPRKEGVSIPGLKDEILAIGKRCAAHPAAMRTEFNSVMWWDLRNGQETIEQQFRQSLRMAQLRRLRRGR